MEDKAPFLELPPGLHDLLYPQDFVRAPASLHPKKAPKPEGANAAKIMNEVCHGEK